MPIAAIHDWLQRKAPFEDGVALLKLHGEPSEADLFIFSLPESTVSHDRLVEALTAVNNAATELLESRVVTPPPAHEPERPAQHSVLHNTISSEPPKSIPEESLPAELRPLRRELTQLHTSLTLMRGIMIKTPDGMELRAIAEEVAELHDKIKAGWNRIELWRKTGQVHLPRASWTPVNKGTLTAERNRLRVWISQRKTGSRKCTPEQMEAKKKRLQAVELQLAHAVTA